MSAPLAELRAALPHPNVRAFLRAIRLGEGTSDPLGYRRIVGGGEFDSLERHPRIYVDIHIKRTDTWIKSSAAGAYQFIWPTWSTLQQRYKLPDFGVESQDLAALALISEKHALSDVVHGRVEAAIEKVRGIWASLPGSGWGQPEKPMGVVLAEYQRHGGTVAT